MTAPDSGREHLLALEAFAHNHEPSTFWYPCFLCEHRTYLRQLADKSRTEATR